MQFQEGACRKGLSRRLVAEACRGLLVASRTALLQTLCRGKTPGSQLHTQTFEPHPYICIDTTIFILLGWGWAGVYGPLTCEEDRHIGADLGHRSTHGCDGFGEASQGSEFRGLELGWWLGNAWLAPAVPTIPNTHVNSFPNSYLRRDYLRL